MKQLFVLMLCCLGVSAYAAPTSTLASLNAVATGDFCQSSTQVPIYGFDIAISGTTTNPQLTALAFTTTGTYTTTDINKFQLWCSTTNSFASAVQIGSNITTTLGTGAHTFSALTQTMTIGSTYYFWITTDATASAVYNHTIAVNAITTANVTVSTGSKAGSTSAGNTMTAHTPTVTITPATVTRCYGAAGNTLTASGATTYTWSPATALSVTTGATPVTTASTTTTYTVTGTVGSCSSTASRLVTVNALPTVTVSNAGPVCSSSITAGGASTYTWSPATGLSATTGATLTPAPSSNTTYTITGTDVNGCVNTTTTTIYAVPSISITSGAVCATGTITASASVTGGTISGYTWAPASGLSATTGSSVTATPSSLTTYTATATSNNGCTNTTTGIAGLPNIAVTPAPGAVCTGSALSLTASGGATYTWSPATYLSATTGAAITTTPTVTGTVAYTVTGTDSRSCVNTASTSIMVGTYATLPWTEGFETVSDAVLCNEAMGPNLAAGSGQDGTGSATTVVAASGTASGYASSPVTIPAHSGSGLAGFGFHANNDYFFTPGFALTSGKTYKFSFWYRIDGGLTYTDDYNAYMVYNTSASLTGATQFTTFSSGVTAGNPAAFTTGNLTSMTNATYQQWTGYFTPVSSGTYYFGINAQNNNLTNTYYWGFDDVAFNTASNCVSPAAASSISLSASTGTSTNVTVTSTADSFICVAIPQSSGALSAGPANGTNYAIGASLGGGTVIAKGINNTATGVSGGYLSPGTAYNFYVYTYQHDTCNGVAYSTTSTTAGSAPSFTTCNNIAPSTPVVDSMYPGTAGTASVTLTGLPTSGTVVVNAWTNAGATIAATPASFSVPSGNSSISMTGASIYTGSNIWFTVSQTVSGCTATSSVSDEASLPVSLPWTQNFETSSSNNNENPNLMHANMGIYTDQTSTMYGAEDNHGATYVTAHGGSYDFLIFGGVTTTMSAPGTGAPYIPLAAYANQWLMTPGLYCPSAGTYKLTFWYNNPSGAFPSIAIQYSNIPTLPSNSSSSMTSATAIATVAPTLAGGWHQYTTTVTLTSSQTIFIGFDIAALSTSGYMAIDDIEFCQVPSVTVTNSTSSATVCATGSITANATVAPVAANTSGSWNYTWSGPGTVTSTTSAATGSSLASVGLNPVYSVSVVNSADVQSLCATSTTTTATVTPVPAAITGASSICGGASSIYSGGATYGTPGWSITGTGASYASGAITTGYNVTTTNPSSQKSITINYSNACGTSTPLTVNINVQPVAITASDFVSAPPTAICTLQTKTLTDNTAGGTWSNSPTTYGTINSSTGAFTSTSTTGTTTISYTMTTGGCYATVSMPVGTTGPGSITGGATSVCIGATTAAFACTPTGGAWSMSSTANATISTSAIVTGVANTNGVPDTIIYNTGCGTAARKTITVGGTTGTVATPATICAGSSLSLSSSVTPTSGTTYAWSGPNAFSSTAASPLVSATATTAANGTYTLTTTNTTCTNKYYATATVATVPATPTITPSASTICSGNTTSLTSSLSNETDQVFSIPFYTPTFSVSNTLNSSTTWTSGNSNDGYYAVLLPFNFSFFGTSYSTLYVGTNGYVTFGSGATTATAAAITAGTPGNVIDLFQNDLTLASSGSITYGTSGSAPNRKFVVAYNSVPGTTAGGPNTGYIVLNEGTDVIDVLVSAFTRNTGTNATCGIANTAGASGIAATGRNNAAYNVTVAEGWRFYSLNNYTYTWSPSGSLSSATVANPSTTALSSNTTYTLTVADAINSACTSSNTSTITVNSAATAVVTSAQACIGASSVNIGYSSVTGSPTTYSITWTSGAISAGFSNVSSATFPGGTSGSIPVSIGSSAAAGSTYHGVITFNNASSCPNSYAFTISLTAQPSLALGTVTLTSPTGSTFCEGQTIQLNVTGATGGATPYLYTWRGPGISSSSTSSTGSLTFTASAASSGAYSVTLSSSSTGCNTTPNLSTAATYTVNASVAPTLSGITASPATLCAGTTLSLSASGASGGTLYTWSGPGGYTSTSSTGSIALTPGSTAASGTYSVTLTNTLTACSSDVASAGTSVTVNPLPYAATITGTSTLCSGQNTTLADTASSGTWSSSNTSVATVDASGIVTAVTNGTSSVSYSVTNSCGTAVASRTVTVNPMSVASVISGNATICTGSTATLTDTASGGSWSSSNTSVATINAATGVVTPVSQGTTNITYTTGCGSQATRSQAIATMPTAITGTTSVCTSSTTSLHNTVAGGTWSSSNTGVATVDASGVVSGITAGSVNITYSNSGCQVTAPATVIATPAAITGTSVFCQAAATTLADAVSYGSWTSSNTGIATVGSSTGIVSGVASGTATITYANGCGTPATQSVTVQSAPASLTGSSTVCVGNATSLTETVPSGTWSSSNAGVASVSGGVVTGVSEGSANISYSLSNSCGTNTVAMTVNVGILGKWLGVNTNWNDASNWPCSTIPDTTVNTEIPSGTPNLPDFTSITANVKNLTIDTLVTITVNSSSNINVKGNLTLKGNIAGNGGVTLNGSSAQSIFGKGTIKNMTLNNASGATINSGDTITLKGALTLSAGTLNTNNGLVFGSDSASTARLAPVATGANITGNVTIRQYVQGGRRAYRFFGHPFSTSIALSQIEQTMDITGTGGSSHGFTNTTTNAPSAYWYHSQVGNSSLGYDPGWQAFTNTNGADTNGFKQYEGIRLFVRGAKNEGLNGYSYTPSPVTISMSGPLNVGNQTMVLHTGANSNYNQVSNPYASPTDIGTAIANAQTAGHVTGGAFYIWNPYLGVAGGYEAKPIGYSYVIGPNTSFQVRAAYDTATLSFTESQKTATVAETLLRSSNDHVSFDILDDADHQWDMMTINFDANASAGEDKNMDAGKPVNPDLNFYSLSSENEKLAIDARPYVAGSIIPLGLTTSYAQDYTIRVNEFSVPGDLYLHDKMLNSYTKLQGGAEYKFTVSKDAASQGNNRFELTTTDVEATAAAAFAVTLAPNPATDNVTLSFNTRNSAETRINITDAAGVNVMAKELGVQQNGSVMLDIHNLPAGIYMVEFTNGSDKKVQKLVKE